MAEYLNDVAKARRIIDAHKKRTIQLTKRSIIADKTIAVFEQALAHAAKLCGKGYHELLKEGERLLQMKKDGRKPGGFTMFDYRFAQMVPTAKYYGECRVYECALCGVQSNSVQNGAELRLWSNAHLCFGDKKDEQGRKEP